MSTTSSVKIRPRRINQTHMEQSSGGCIGFTYDGTRSMSQSTRRAGRPTKRPRLIKHTTTASLDAVHRDRHRIFSLQPNGNITLRTSYIPESNLTPDDPGESTLFDAQPEPADLDPWNEVEHFTPVICEDANIGSEVLKARHQKTIRVCLACFKRHTNLTLQFLG